MSKTVYLLQYNNYFNRTVRGEHYYLIGNYTANGAKIVGQITNMSLWNPNDGIDTTITSTLGMTAVPDYCVVCDGINVLQRWYVVEAKRLQGQQYRLTLHRDTIAEEYALIMSNKANYVERGWCDVVNSAIYNAEPMTFNQIKINQRSLYDISQCPWIVFYFAPAKKIDGADTNFPQKTVTWKYNGTNYSIECQYDPTGITSYILQTKDVPYAICALPYATRDYYGIDGTKMGSLELKNALACAMAISRAYSSSGWLIDVQLLPYCPCREVLRSDGSIDLTKARSYAPIKVVGETNSTFAGMISVESSTFAATLYTSKGQVFKHTVTNVKMDSLTTKCRLVSPNGNGVFEFNPAKMVYSNGAQLGFEAYCTYMPYQPYIRVAPQFARLYGEEFGDYRGLICGGDFSLPQISDSWEAYQAQNKNYQVMFNRQIQSLELQQRIGLAQDISGTIAGTVGAAVGGTALGGGIGAAVMGAAGAIGGVADIATNTMLRKDQREATVQQHNWQLQNIQALPYSVTKVSNFNIDNTYVPYLELYNCDDYETQNLGSYLELNSYAINRYGKFADYIKPIGRTFLRGTPIRLDGITDDAHYAAAIADELKQGFYVGTDETTTTTNGGTN